MPDPNMADSFNAYEDLFADSDPNYDTESGDLTWADMQEVGRQDLYIYQLSQKAKQRYHRMAQRDRDFWQLNRDLMRKRCLVTNCRMLYYNIYHVPEHCMECSEVLNRDDALNCRSCGPTSWFCSMDCLSKTHSLYANHCVYRMDPKYGFQFVRTVSDHIGSDFCSRCEKTASYSPVLLVSQDVTTHMNVMFCAECSSIGDALQKLHYFPARYGAVKHRYAFSTDVLDLYRTLSLLTGISMYKFIRALIHLQPELPTPFTEKMIYRAFTQVSVEFRRACTSIARLDDVGLNDLFTRCRCCPRPGEEGRLHIAADGNFSAFRHNRKNQNVDMSEMENNFFVAESRVDEYMLTEPTRKRIADDKGCSDFAALSNPNKRRFGEMDETGMFAIYDARHETPLKVMDMKKGETFSLLDLLLIEYLDGNVAQVTLYYDVCCRYKRHVEIHPDILGAAIAKFTFVIPSFHCYAHGECCIKLYYPGTNRGCGKTEGEVSERCWSYTNIFSITARDMSKLNRRVLYEDVFHYAWSNAQFKAPKVIAEKLTYVADDLELFESERESWPESDETLEQWTKDYKNVSKIPVNRVVDNDSPNEITMHNIESKIRYNRMEISHLHTLLNRRFANRTYHILILEHKKTKARMYKRSRALYSTIEKLIEQRNSLCPPYVEGIELSTLPHFHRHLDLKEVHDPKRDNWFWRDHRDPSSFEKDMKVLSYNKLLRLREELEMLRDEQNMWCTHAQMDIQRLQQHHDLGIYTAAFDCLKAREIETYRQSGLAGGLYPIDGNLPSQDPFVTP